MCIGSDSHDASGLCANFDRVKSALPQGLSVCYFESGKLVPLK